MIGSCCTPSPPAPPRADHPDSGACRLRCSSPLLSAFGAPPLARTGIRSRTAAVRNAILAKINGVTDCALVTATHLAAITELALEDQSITALAAGDFDGLTALTGLVVSRNGLPALRPGVFDDLTALSSGSR